jgi:hypothetical protein
MFSRWDENLSDVQGFREAKRDVCESGQNFGSEADKDVGVPRLMGELKAGAG